MIFAVTRIKNKRQRSHEHKTLLMEPTEKGSFVEKGIVNAI